jgi:hypothetical protein
MLNLNLRGWHLGSALALALGLTACASIPPAVAELPWADAWGSRGPQVLGRDYAMCAQLVEQHRSLLTGCMAARGWGLPPG